MTTKKTRIKAQAVAAPQTRDDVAAEIKKIGDVQREITRMQAEMNDEIGAITERFQPQIDTLNAQIKVMQAGVQSWSEANRDELTQGGKVKFANLITGEVSWRNRPPSVAIRGQDTVIEALQSMKLERFIRVKEEINKEAILNEPDAVKFIAGITIKSGVEDFIITPFEQDIN